MLNNSISNAGLKQLFADEDVYLINNNFTNNTKNVTIEKVVKSIEKPVEKIEIFNDKPVELVEESIPQKEIATSKTVLIIVDKLTESGKMFLEKILGAVNLDFNKVEIQELEPGKSKTFGEYLKGKAGIVKSLIFGVPLSDLGFKISMENYALQQLKHIQFLSIDKLSAIEANQNLKRKLWTSLQEMFK